MCHDPCHTLSLCHSRTHTQAEALAHTHAHTLGLHITEGYCSQSHGHLGAFSLKNTVLTHKTQERELLTKYSHKHEDKASEMRGQSEISLLSS